MNAAISRVRGRRVWDSRGRPTVEVEVELAGGAAGRAIAPAGASRGSREAIDLRDGGPRFKGMDVSGAIANVPRGQWEAARSLGLHTPAIYWRVVLPQALMVALRPYGNEVVLMIKASAVASVVTVFDLMGVTRLAFSRSFDFEVYFWAAGLYLLLTEGVRLVWGAMERRLTRHLAPAGAREMGGAPMAAARTPVTAAGEGRR